MFMLVQEQCQGPRDFFFPLTPDLWFFLLSPHLPPQTPFRSVKFPSVVSVPGFGNTTS